jgi:hypothetical protein
MKIDLLIMQLAIIFLPGLIWARLDARFALTAKPSDTEFVIRAFVFGLASYAVTFGLYSLFGWTFTVADLGDAGTHTIVNAAIAKEIVSALVVGLVLSIIWIYAATYKWLTRFLQIIGATRTYGDEDVWDCTFNSPRPEVEYVNFRDFDNKVIYSGYVNTFSETEKLRELVLRDVQVFNIDGVLQFEMPLLYIARKPENIHIEFPYRPDGEAGNDRP